MLDQQPQKPTCFSTESMMTIDLFERRFQIRTTNQLVLPPTPLSSLFEFPRDSVYHFVATDGIQEGPANNDPRLATVDKKITVEVIRELTGKEGGPTPISVNLQSQIDAWHRVNKRFRKARDAVTEAPNDQTLAVFNYAWLPKLFRYTRSIYTERYRWVNTWATVFDKIELTARTSSRKHFIFIDLPQQLPSIQRMSNLVGKPDQTVVRTLQDPNEWMVFELFKWLDPSTKEASIFNRISDSAMNRVRLIIQDGGRFICFDPSKILEWVITPKSTAAQKVRISAGEMQKRVLRGIMGLMAYRSPVVLDAETGEIDVDAQQSQIDQTTNANTMANVDENETTQKRAEQILAAMDDDLAQLDEFDAARQIEDLDQSETSITGQRLPGTKSTQVFDAPKTVQEAITAQTDALADMGVLSAPEYRKITKLVEKSAALPSPYDSTRTIKEYAHVSHEETKLSPAQQLPDSITLVDKSMREASLKDFDPLYIEKFLPRDTVAMVHGMQKAGFIVTDYQVEKVEDVMGKFEFHTVKLTPLVGLPSTLRFKLPAVDATGKVKAGGTEYRYRKQRIDLPIRKISASQVALSSYYGKNFVSRCDRAAYDYGRWLQREVVLQSIGDAPVITHLQTANVYDNECKASRSYTALSENYKGFTCKDAVFTFDWASREKYFGADTVTKLGSQGLTPCAKTASGSVYALDEHNTLYEVTDGNATPMESLTSFLGIDDTKTPIEFTECRIFGKNIPSGLVLGYYYGLSELISMLGCSLRRVSAGQRLNLQPGEWSLPFEDETLIFSRDDRVATLILAGLRTLDKSLKRYSVHAFDNQAVYLNILEQNGMSVRYLRELDFLDKLFVDSITERILIRMKEPTTYRGLVKRATEMLLLDEHPRLLDARQMRWRGMERVAGAVYTEMVQSMRDHGAKSGKSHARVEMNPYSIWKRVMQDPAMNMVKDINPIQNLKEIEAVTYTGHGGRSSRSMTRKARYFDDTEMGITSEATSDSKDVAVNTYLSASPRFDNLEGMVKEPTYADTSATSLLSTSGMLSPSLISED